MPPPEPSYTPARPRPALGWDDDELSTRIYVPAPGLLNGEDAEEGQDVEYDSGRLIDPEAGTPDRTTPLDIHRVRALLGILEAPGRSGLDAPKPEAANPSPKSRHTSSALRPVEVGAPPPSGSATPDPDDGVSTAGDRETPEYAPDFVAIDYVEAEDQITAPGFAGKPRTEEGPDLERYLHTHQVEISKKRAPASSRWGKAITVLGINVALAIVAFATVRLLEFNQPGVITLVTSPVDATVTVDGKRWGSLSPFIKTGAKPRTPHIVEVSKSGFLTWRQPVEVQANQTITLHVELAPIPDPAVEQMPASAENVEF